MYGKLIISLIIIVSFVGLTACGGSKKKTEKAPEPKTKIFETEGTIYYSSGKHRARRLHVMKPDGSNPRSLIQGATKGDYTPSLSPDGKNLVFTTSRFGQWRIAIAKTDGSDLKLMIEPSPGYENAVTYSPDGKTVAFSGAPGPGQAIWHLFSANGEGKKAKKVIETDFQFFKPSFSPDGNRLLFEKADARATFSDICLINPDGSDIVNLTNDKGTRDCSASWSPDGQTIAYISVTGQPQVNLSTVSRNGQNKRIIASKISGYPSPGIIFYFRTCWSPNGKQILYSAHDGKDFEIYRINADGTNKVQVTSNDVDDVHPYWTRHEIKSR